MKAVNAIAGLIMLCILIGLLFVGCGKKEQTNTVPETPGAVPESGATIRFVNGLEEADVWILPETEENLKTTLWGTATIAKLGTGAEQSLSLDALGGPGTYILRMIDTNHMYYSVNGLTLADGCTVQIRKSGENMSALVEITDAGGAAETYSVFAGRL